MTTDNRAEFFALIERANRIGALLPEPEEIDVDDPAAVAEVKLVLSEFNAALAAIRLFSRK
ncbi:hypothetical protein XH80_01920 [Bradyrhizobium sp. CCBAU 45384]|nr:hypothetical protein [Bradyrhizobium sp. CCBAU 45384]